MATISHTQVRAIVEGGGSVVDTVTASTAIPPELFVFLTADDLFSRIASIADINTWPNSKPAAVSAGKAYYRSATCTRVFPSIANAQEWAALVPATFKRLAVEWTATSSFAGTTTETITG